MTPQFINHCSHDAHEFVGRYTIERDGTRTPVDLYVYEDGTFGPEVCMRYGNEGHEYIAPNAGWPRSFTILHHYGEAILTAIIYRLEALGYGLAVTRPQTRQEFFDLCTGGE